MYNSNITDYVRHCYYKLINKFIYPFNNKTYLQVIPILSLKVGYECLGLGYEGNETCHKECYYVSYGIEFAEDFSQSSFQN